MLKRHSLAFRLSLLSCSFCLDSSFWHGLASLNLVISTQHHYSAEIDFDMHEFKLFFFIHALRYHHVFGIKWKKRKCPWWRSIIVWLTLKGPWGGIHPPPSTYSRNNLADIFPAHRAFATFFFWVLRNFWRYFRTNPVYRSDVTQRYVIERRLKIWEFSGFAVQNIWEMAFWALKVYYLGWILVNITVIYSVSQ